MIIRKVNKVRTADPCAFAWAALRKFQNVEMVAAKLQTIHSPPAKYKDDIRKQAKQIRHCLIQAREYFKAAEAVSLATKPNLLYYGIMSLALAEILFKQSGKSSLDKAREEHRHHGLTMTVGASSKSASLAEAAELIRARPIEKEGSRRGTFELWRRTMREHPLGGERTNYWPNSGSTIGFDNLYGASDDFRYPEIPNSGVTLAECFANLPLMAEHVVPAGIETVFVRGKCVSQAHHGDQWSENIVIILHPSHLVEKLIEEVKVNANAIERISITEASQGLIIQLHFDWINGDIYMPLPPAVMSNSDEWRMWVTTPALNEFGYFYVALYLAGNYARYYPDKWLDDVEASSALSLAIEELCEIATWRAPWLTLCELDQILHVNEA